MNEDHFDTIADAELHRLEKAFDAFDPDELEVDLAMGVLSATLGDGSKVIINSHRAAGQIWMAAFRTAWHFTPHEEGGVVTWRTGTDELHAALSRLLSEKLGRDVRV
ncbi:MAG: iron donor protein CyaY [Myxococcales bacterium]|nr:iron donor protein CyaY [Myxococcales bacterium]